MSELLNGDIGTCPDCGKKRFVYRKDARRFARDHFPGERMSPYKCGDYFHFGHMPLAVKTSTISRAAYTQGKERQRRKERARMARQERRLDQGV